jgi:hypothetical protein
MNRVILTTVLLSITATSALAWNARYAPSESAVSWPVPENPTDRAVNLFAHDLLGETTILAGDVQVAGEDGTRSFISRLDDSGNILWSRRIPFSRTDFLDFNLVKEDTAIVAYTSDESGTELDILGSFDPTNSFSSRYTKSVPSLPVDPLNPLAGGSRTYQSQPNGDLAMVQIESNKVNVLMLNATGGVRFAKTYTMPSGGGGLPFPIPGFGTSYLFAIVSNLENGDYYLTTSGTDLLSQSTTAYVLRLDSAGSIIWQAGVAVPGATAIVLPLLDERIVVAGGGTTDGSTFTSSLAVLSAAGELEFAKSIPGTIIAGNSFLHYSEAGNLLFSGNIPTSISEAGFKSDGVVLMLSSTGEKLAEIAYNLGEFDQITHVGTTSAGLYFELYGFDSNDGTVTHGLLARSDENLENWISRSYIENAGPSAVFSTFFTDGSNPFLSYRDDNQDWIYVNELDADLQELGDCDLLVDEVIPFYDPNLAVNDVSPTVQTNSVSSSTWATAPALADFPFSLEETPFTVEFVCGDTGGGGGGGGGGEGNLTAGEWKQIDFGWVFGLTEDWGISTYMGYVYVADLPYVYQVDLGWMYLVASSGSDHYFYTWDRGWILINEAFGGYYYIYATDDYTQQIPQP